MIMTLCFAYLFYFKMVNVVITSGEYVREYDLEREILTSNEFGVISETDLPEIHFSGLLKCIFGEDIAKNAIAAARKGTQYSAPGIGDGRKYSIGANVDSPF
jgi:hypothetical protein